jgi:eukaryotic-like serine/threonine-protein kinase
MTSDLLSRLQSALGAHYSIERELGRGGMATVYLARDLKHDREVALKVLRPELTAILGRERFLNEVRLTAKLDHPHILTLIDSGETEGPVVVRAAVHPRRVAAAATPAGAAAGPR